jgi:SARP family transcriptional regulator, regulator of embCAB operon
MNAQRVWCWPQRILNGFSTDSFALGVIASFIHLVGCASTTMSEGAAKTGRAASVTGENDLRFGLMGPLLLAMAATPLPLGTPKQRGVLAMLLINRNHTVSTESLINAVWDESPVPGARATVQTLVSNLRRLVSTAGADPQTVLASAPPGYQLGVADGACDLDRFISRKTAGFRAAAAGRFDEASANLSAALAESRGPALADVRDFSFAEAFATALTEDTLLVHTARAEAEIACGRSYAVIGELEGLVTEHPYREPLWAQLMTAYYVSDRQSDALEAYRRLRSVLDDDLGIEPSATISTLHARILRQEKLDTAESAKTTAESAVRTAHTAFAPVPVVAGLRDAKGRLYPITAGATRIGRHPDSDIVLNDIKVSRHHAVIIDTGSSFVITDLGSANGVHVEGRRLHPTASLADGDHVRICGHEFTFENQPR